MKTALPNSRTLWVVPEKSGGIRTYAEGLLPAFGKEVDVIWNLPEDLPDMKERKLVHLQHEFGLFGSKVPGLYELPRWLRAQKKKHPKAKWVATAHNVIPENYRFPTNGKGWGTLPRILANLLLLSYMRRTWTRGTWGEFDGVIVHSKHQRDVVLRSGCKHVAVIPHYVPPPGGNEANDTKTEKNTVVLFGYFTPDKGQDIAIRAWSLLGKNAPKLILAGGVRREEDEKYFQDCKELIRTLKLEDHIKITGFVPRKGLDDLYRNARLVIAPFRYTSGSGSLATAFSRGAAVLTSDLPLNLEIDERTPGSLAFFKSESPESLAEKVVTLWGDHPRLMELRDGSRRYAETYSPENTAKLHRNFYNEVLTGEIR